MANITIRNLEDDVKTRLRLHADEHQRSMEEEVRTILRETVNGERIASQNLASFTPLGGVELEIPPRGPMREPL